jgi:hypothetical protein
MDPAQFSDLEVIFTNFVGALLGFAGILFFILFVVGGFRYLTSGGDPKAIAGAHSTLTHAILGLVLVILTVSILALIEVITGANVSTFRIVQP